MIRQNIVTCILFLISRWFFVLSVAQQEECSKGFEYRDPPMHLNTAQIISDPVYRNEGFGLGDLQYNKQSPQVYFINGSLPGQQFIICTSPKSGSSRMKLLLFKILFKDYDGQFNKTAIGWKVYNPIQLIQTEELQRLFSDPKIPRIQVVRNPYIRAISMFESKILRNGPSSKFYQRMMGYQEGQDLSFDFFVDAVYKKYTNPRLGTTSHEYLDKHFQPQTDLCYQHLGMTYNYILKMEEMDDWFDCFVDLVNIREEAQHGWPREDNCYLSTTKSPCNGPAVANGVILTDLKYFKSQNTGSAEKYQQYYQDQRVRQLVSQIYRNDFLEFNYTFAA